MIENRQRGRLAFHLYDRRNTPRRSKVIIYDQNVNAFRRSCRFCPNLTGKGEMQRRGSSGQRPETDVGANYIARTTLTP